MKPRTVKGPKLKYKKGDVVSHLSDKNTIGIVIETMEPFPQAEVVRLISGNQYQVYWSICPPGDEDPVECWYPEEHIIRIDKEITQ